MPVENLRSVRKNREGWKKNPKDYRHIYISECDIEWVKEKNRPYKYHIKLIHKPTNMCIEQASERNWQEAKDSCLMTLKWRMANWDEYLKSRVRHLPTNE